MAKKEKKWSSLTKAKKIEWLTEQAALIENLRRYLR